MYQNKVSLIGFLGGDAEARNASNRSFTALSLATKSSYKDTKNGQYVSQTEWHRCVVLGKLAEFAATLTKGAHVQIEGELRSREIAAKNSDFKQRIWEIRVDSILKLDREERKSILAEIARNVTAGETLTAYSRVPKCWNFARYVPALA